MGGPHTPSPEDELPQPRRQYLGKGVNVKNGHTPFKPAIPLGGIYPTDLLSHTCPMVYLQGHPLGQDETQWNMHQQGTGPMNPHHKTEQH